tara:strand:+ start:266 stop:472 length:207 start_codon:yes stop_codon:yes gene_type:complete
MVASDSEGREIVRIMCQWIPAEYLIDMMDEVYEVVGTTTENDSLRDTITLLQHYLSIAISEIDYGGNE